MANRPLNVGHSGPDVHATQQALNTWGAAPPLRPDGVFGPKTETAVRRFQEKRRLNVHGTVDRSTRRALYPAGVATVTVYGTRRLEMPATPTLSDFNQRPAFGLSLDPTHSTPNLSSAISSYFKNPHYGPIRFPGLSMPLPGPAVPDWDGIPPSNSPSGFKGFEYDHVEAQPGRQVTFPFRRRSQAQGAFILTMQSVFLHGPDNGKHLELDLGAQMATTSLSHNSPWSLNPFIQITDVDRFWHFGHFHLWQMFAQAGIQIMGLRSQQPSLTAQLCPLNVGIDINDLLSVSLQGSVTANISLQTGHVTVGGVLFGGITFKLGR
jgi:Putative peptidoglycan binding domain